MKRCLLLLATVLTLWSCGKDYSPEDFAPADWRERTDGFSAKYELEQLVVLSRHNIRTPLVGKGSVLSRVTATDNQWFVWQDPSSHLTAKGQRLEKLMGDFFREWLGKEGFVGQYSADPSSFRFYANAKQRCQLTARTFADALLPGANAEVEMKVAFDTMDPVFNPQITKLPAGFEEKAKAQIAARMGVSIATFYRRFPANKK